MAATTMDMVQAHMAPPLPSTSESPVTDADAVCPDAAAGLAADHGPAQDCRMSTVCDFACGLHFVLPAAAAATIAALLPAEPVAVAARDHAPPVLVHPIRPPIH